MSYTRASLELVHKEGGFPPLREIGASLGVKSTSAQAIIVKILAAQNDVPVPDPANTRVELVYMDDLLAQKRNTEVPYGDEGDHFPSLVPKNSMESLEQALTSFSHQWNFNKIEFFHKFQAFRLYKDGQHVDWIGLNDMTRRYQLKIPVAARTAARRLYTAPTKRAYS